MPDRNVSNETGVGLPSTTSEPGGGFTTDYGEQVGGRPLTPQEKYDRFLLPQRQARLSDFLGERRAVRSNQAAAGFGRNEELARRLGVSGTGLGSALHSAASGRAAQASALDDERARSQFDRDIAGFEAAEMARLMTPRTNVTDGENALNVMKFLIDTTSSIGSMAAGGGGSVPGVSAGSPSQPQGGGFTGEQSGSDPMVSGTDSFASTLSQRSGGGGIGRFKTPAEEEEERRRREQRQRSAGFSEFNR